MQLKWTGCQSVAETQTSIHVHIHTDSHFEISIIGLWEEVKEPVQAQGEHVNLTQSCPTGGFLLWGDYHAVLKNTSARWHSARQIIWIIDDSSMRYKLFPVSVFVVVELNQSVT